MRAAAAIALLCCFFTARADDPYRFFDWKVTYGSIYPLGIRQTGILINRQFPGPTIHSRTNDNLIINVHNYLKEPFLISWSGVQQRRNSWQDGVAGTNCPIPPGKNFTYVMQVKDQIGSFYYFPSLGFQKASGGFGGLHIVSRPRIPVPFPPPAGDFTVLIGDWYKAGHLALQHGLDLGHALPFPDGVLINGQGFNGAYFTVHQGKTYRFRISNVGLRSTLSFRIQGHKMKLVEVEGTHTVQTSYTSIDVHVGQSLSVLVTADRHRPRDYYIAVHSRFTKRALMSTGVLHYGNSVDKVHGRLPSPPRGQIKWSLDQARSIRTNLTASGPRPNPQGSYHYGKVRIDRTIKLASSSMKLDGKQRYAVNGASFVPATTPLKLADYFKIRGVFRAGGIPAGKKMYLGTSVIDIPYTAYVEIVFENKESIVQTWHLDGYSFWVVGMEGGRWSRASRRSYNMRDAVSRSTTQVYPRSWTAVLVSFDNIGMWNLRTEVWARQYLGQQLYLRVQSGSPLNKAREEHPVPRNVLLCGQVAGRSF